ncbi:MAG: hypothetical protein ACKO1Q_09745, partial [Vulcanococcus sp.]
MPLLVALAFLSVCLLPFVVSWVEASREPQASRAAASAISHDYQYRPQTLEGLEQAFANANDIKGFR